jgi:DNA gyrase subunit A
LGGEARAVGMLVLRRDAAVMTVTEQGVGRRTDVDEFPVQKRGGLGTIAVASDAGGELVGALEVLPEDEIVLVRRTGVATTLRADTAPLQGRRGKGQRLVELGDDVIVEVARGSEGARDKRSSETPEPAGAGGPDGEALQDEAAANTDVAAVELPGEEADDQSDGEDQTERSGVDPGFVNRIASLDAESQLDLLGNGEDSGE